MAQPINNDLAKQIFTNKRTRSNGYPWDLWLDGRLWELIPNQDYSGTSSSFRTAAYAAAKVRGVKVRTHFENGKMYIQRSVK